MKDEDLLRALQFKFVTKNQRIKDLEKEVAQLKQKELLTKQEKNSS